MVPDRASPVFRLVHAYTGGEHQDECADAYRKDADRIQPGHDEGLGKETNRGTPAFRGHPHPVGAPVSETTLQGKESNTRHSKRCNIGLILPQYQYNLPSERIEVRLWSVFRRVLCHRERLSRHEYAVSALRYRGRD